eukprot:CAMPEP_0198217868 /NCGR_PEP_ID=MMETSP1445-20131203/66220_1 /TAXON_ID=36898 /ORGANISM="Pyramimonas sp., Strain CCMP2087" /LENGTH=342 /DNA_ID=CAMNT_0043894703 /DNA_START=302 /DNA_END=1330 /DNA_ORIENTATION=+
MYTKLVVQTSLLNKLDFCSQHNDTACHLSTESSDKCNSFVWEKEFMLLRHLHEHEWLLWVDCDALMVDLARSLESISQHAQPTEDLIVYRDRNFYNLGVMMIRSSAWSEWFLKTLLEMRDWVEHLGGAWRDQKALTILLHKYPEIHSHIRLVNASAINSYAPRFRPGDFVYHQVNCKYSKAGGKAKINMCQQKFLERAQWSRETSQAEGGKLVADLPPVETLNLKASKVRPSLMQSFGCITRKLALMHLDTTKAHLFPTKPFPLRLVEETETSPQKRPTSSSRSDAEWGISSTHRGIDSVHHEEGSRGSSRRYNTTESRASGPATRTGQIEAQSQHYQIGKY